MKTFLKHPRTLLIAGLVLMLAGALDPLAGSVVIPLGSALAAGDPQVNTPAGESTQLTPKEWEEFEANLNVSVRRTPS